MEKREREREREREKGTDVYGGFHAAH